MRDDFFEKFIADPEIKYADQALIYVQGAVSSVIQIRQRARLALPSSELENGGFETGDLCAWEGSGDSRVLSQFDYIAPVSGDFFGLVSTGLGFSTTSGSVAQKFCLPLNARNLEFYWNFSSEEFLEWCGDIYQDYFRVHIITDSGIYPVFQKNIDDLCGSVRPALLKFDKSSDSCISSAGNDCIVWTTDWKFESADLSEIVAGADQDIPVTIQFSAGDVGDSIFDSAILLDDIRITTGD